MTSVRNDNTMNSCKVTGLEGAESCLEKRNGKGLTKFQNRDIYEGDYKNGLKHGKGIYKFVNGDLNEGGWQSNVRQGLGTYMFAAGGVYQGSWSDNKMHGKGVHRFPNGDVYAVLGLEISRMDGVSTSTQMVVIMKASGRMTVNTDAVSSSLRMEKCGMVCSSMERWYRV